MKHFLFCALVFVYSCKLVLPPSERYTITQKGIRSKTGCQITNMSISKFRRDDESDSDIRPKDRNEITRYCCWLKNGRRGKRRISFLEADGNYSWYLCKLDMSILESDSLNSLTLTDKLAYSKKMELEAIKDKNYVHRDSFPLIVQKGYVYQVFGLCDVDGSYYFCLDANGKLIVQYKDAGPW